MLRLPWSPLGCVTALLAVLDICQAHNPKDNPEYYVFRGDSRGPQEIRDTGGFLPDPDATSYSNPTTFSLDNHVNGRTGSSAYVATSAQFGQAARNFAGPGNYVYRIHVTPNMINVNEALTSGHPYPRQEEASALGGIPWTAVEGWLQLDEDREFETSSEYLDDGSADRFTARYVAEFADQFELNRAYDDSGLGGPARQTRADPQVALLAAQPPNQERLLNAATAFMNSHASAIGWTENQAFPYSPPSPPQSTEPLALQDVDVSTIPDAEREDLTEGRFDSLNCLALAVTLGTALLQTKGPNSKRYLPRAASVLLKSRDDKKAQCQQLRDVLRRLMSRAKGSGVQILHPCKKIKNIEFGLNLANEYWGLGGEGTWDDIGGILEGKAGKAEFKIAEQPALGSSWWTPVKFPSDTIDITGIDKLSLTAEPHLWRWAQRDWFKVKDIRIRAQCADPGFEAKNDKYVGISQWYRHNGGGAIWQEPFTKKAVATLPIHPGDWTFAPPCNIIKDLSYEFTLANGWGDGTGDKLTLILGEGIIFLGNSFKAGSTIKDKIDIKKTFNKDTIDIRDLKTVAIGDDNSGAGLFDKSWTLQGVTFSATCADVSKKMQMKKFASENKEVSHKDNGPAWTGNIDAADWVEVA